MKTTKANDRLFSVGLWAWLAILEKDAGRLSEGGRVALGLLREDLEKIAQPEPSAAEIRGEHQLIGGVSGVGKSSKFHRQLLAWSPDSFAIDHSEDQ